MKIGQIKLGQSTKTYKHDLGCFNETTMDFGHVQPLYCTYLEKGDNVVCDYRQILRPAPMPAPTLAKIDCHNVSRFVPMNEIYPAYDLLLSGKPVSTNAKTYYPTELPFTTNAALVVSLIIRYGQTVSYTVNSGTGVASRITSFPDDVTTGIGSCIRKCSPVLEGHWNDLNAGKLIVQRDNVNVTLNNADFVFSTFTDDAYSNTPNLVCVKLNDRGRFVRKILKGLGYGLDPTNDNHVNFLPILAFYKAYFDTYFVQRYINWHDTPIYRYIIRIYDTDYTTFNDVNDLGNVFNELEDCWYSQTADFVSAHTSSLFNQSRDNNIASSNADATIYPITAIDSTGTNANAIATGTKTPSLPNSSTPGKFNLFQLQTLQRITQYIVKDSLIGQRVADWIKVHFGTEPSDDMFADSNYYGDHVTSLSIEDIYSTSNTYNSQSGDGSLTGSYAGKGFGLSSSDTIKFTAPNFGYFIVLSAIAPITHYYQGDNPQLYGLDKYTLPSADFDRLGYELTPFACIFDQDYVNAISGYKLTSESFGYIPRFSGFKAMKSVVNGDLSLRSTRDNLDFYHCEAKIVPSQIVLDEATNKVSQSMYNVPKASTNWRYPGSIPNIGDYNRIFFQGGFDINKQKESQQISYLQPLATDDNFVVQTRFDVSVYNSLAPIAESYDSFIDDVDNSTTTVTGI